MSYQVEQLIQLALKEQAIKGTAEGSFQATDVVEVEAGAKFTHSPHVRNIRLVSGGYGWSKSIIGPREVGISAFFAIQNRRGREKSRRYRKVFAGIWL